MFLRHVFEKKNEKVSRQQQKHKNITQHANIECISEIPNPLQAIPLFFCNVDILISYLNEKLFSNKIQCISYYKVRAFVLENQMTVICMTHVERLLIKMKLYAFKLKAMFG